MRQRTREEEGKRIKAFLEERKAYLLNLLLDQGAEDFISAINRDATILKMQYEICSLTFKEGSGWKKWDGSILTESGWEYPDGKVQEDGLSKLLSAKDPEKGITVA